MQPIVTPKEMVRLEQIAYNQGYSEEQFMESAGKGIAKAIPHDKKWVHLLCGKGNNGADGLVALRYLMNAGYQTSCTRPEDLSICSALLQKQYARYIKQGGKETQTIPPECDLILDGIFGTGFTGIPKPPFDEWIKQANQSQIPLFSIDIPSGLDAETGAVQAEAIQAERTLYLGLAKRGFFLQQGYHHTGKLQRIDFGLPATNIGASINPSMLLQTIESVHLPPIKRDQHKYTAGYVAGIGGMGALFLAGLASLRSGSGIVKLFYTHLPSICAPLELIHSSYRLIEEVFPFIQNAKALFVGPGMGLECKNFEEFLFSIKIPLVLDADALNLIAKEKLKIPPFCILTPHRAEFERLIGASLLHGITENLLKIGASFVHRHNCTLVLKGPPTLIFHPKTVPILCDRGDPGMATAGTGDVLTGIIAALLANGNKPIDAARFAVCLHGVAGEIAALRKGSRSMIASDLIESLAEVFSSLTPYQRQELFAQDKNFLQEKL